MGKLVELKIAAQSEDEFDELCHRAKALIGVIIQAETATEWFCSRLVTAFRSDAAALVVMLELDADAVRTFDLSLNGRETLLAIEGLVRH